MLGDDAYNPPLLNTCRITFVTSRHAVCYVATSGYLFQTVLSALQARRNLDDAAGVFVLFLGHERQLADGVPEFDVFRPLCAEGRVELLAAPIERLNGLHPMFGRLFLDAYLPPDVEQVLYLDGDTQVVGDITPLMFAEVQEAGMLAVRDPMVFIRRTNEAKRAQIDGWWDAAELAPIVRHNYINSGVLRCSREFLLELGERSVEEFRAGHGKFRFADQDAINRALAGQVGTISMRWNFPGFLLDTQFVDLVPPRILHFMSDPRPWHGPFPPWGARYFKPYVDLVRDHPEVRPYWPRVGAAQRAKYALQQVYKRYKERPDLQSPAAATAVAQLEKEDLTLG